MRYKSVVDKRTRKHNYEHRIVWESHNGKIPRGFIVHHIDGNGLNNDLSNLVLVSKLQHSRLHAGCYVKDGRWIKPCRRCGEHKDIEEGYTKDYYGYPRSWCRKCMRAYEVERLKGLKK